MNYDVAIIGTGPAGSSAAYELAVAGLRVVMIDKATFPRYKTCGGGLVARAIDALPFDVSSVVERTCHSVDVRLISAGVDYVCTRDTPIVRMTMRDRLDALLAVEAEKKGATWIPGCLVRDVEVTPCGVSLRTDRGAVHAAMAIGADGATGVLARAAGWEPNPFAAPALEWEVRVSDRMLDRWRDTARFDFGFTPHGYAWVFPKRDRLSVGVLNAHRGRTPLAGYLESYMSQCGIPRNAPAEKHGYVIPLGPVAPKVTSERVILVGDAAGFADPLLAEGISFAILSGQLAARAIIATGLNDRKARRTYQAAVRKQILREHRVARWFARGVYEPTPFSLSLIRRYKVDVSETIVDVFSGITTYQAALRRPGFSTPFDALRQGV